MDIYADPSRERNPLALTRLSQLDHDLGNFAPPGCGKPLKSARIGTGKQRKPAAVPTKSLAKRPGFGSLAPCFCATSFAARTARSTATGASWRTAGCRRADGAAACAVSGRDQRQPESRVVPDDRGFRRGRAAGQTDRAVSRGPGARRRSNCDVVHVRLSGLQLHRPRQWGGCWLACHLWDQLRLDDFWSPRLPASREGTAGWTC